MRTILCFPNPSASRIPLLPESLCFPNPSASRIPLLPESLCFPNPSASRIPLLPESHYALSKLAGEAIAAQFSRWGDTPYVALRISNIMTEGDYQRFPSFWDDAMIRSWNLWGYVDARDVAQVTRLALTADVEGADAFLVAAADTYMTRPSTDLMAEVYPEVPIRTELSEHQTLLSIGKATTQLGYRLQHSWRDHITQR